MTYSQSLTEGSTKHHPDRFSAPSGCEHAGGGCASRRSGPRPCPILGRAFARYATESRAMIRSVTEGDAEAIHAIYAPIVRETIVSFETQPPSVTELQERIAKSHEWLVYEREGRVVGYAYAAPFHERAGYMWSVEVSIYVGTDARGSGLGKKLLTAASRTAEATRFRQRLRRDRPPQSGERPPLRILGFRCHRQAAAGRLQVGGLARRGVVAAPTEPPNQPPAGGDQLTSSLAVDPRLMHWPPCPTGRKTGTRFATVET